MAALALPALWLCGDLGKDTRGWPGYVCGSHPSCSLGPHPHWEALLQVLSKVRGGCWCSSFALRCPRYPTAHKAAGLGLTRPPHMGFTQMLSPGKAVLDVGLKQWCGSCGPYVPTGLCVPCVCCVLYVAVWSHLVPPPSHLPDRRAASKGMVRSGPTEMLYSRLQSSWAPRAMVTKWPSLWEQHHPVPQEAVGGGLTGVDRPGQQRVVGTHVGTSPAIRLKA